MSGATGTAGGFDSASQKITGQFTFGNWPLYIDQTKNDGERVHPSLELFQKEKGITVDYKEVIQAYDEFFAKLRNARGRTAHRLRPDRHGLPEVAPADGDQ